MLKLCRIRPFHVAQRRVRLHNPAGDQVVQAQQVLVVAQPVEVPPAEGQRAEVLRDRVQQAARRGDS